MNTAARHARIASIDTFRVIAIIFVIVIHTHPFLSEGRVLAPDTFMSLGQFLNQISRFAVPFFFVISGYFFAVRVQQTEQVKVVAIGVIKRLVALIVFWNIFYILPHDLSSVEKYGILGPLKTAYVNVKSLYSEGAVNFLLQGTKVHLWFLQALLMSTIIAACLFRWRKTLLLLAAALYIFGVLGQAYQSSPIGVDPGFNTRNGPFFGTLLFVLGSALTRFNPKPNWLWIGGMIFLAGALLQFGELYWLWTNYKIVPNSDYVFGTLLMGLGAAVAALSNHRILEVRYLSNAGLYTLGVYGIHIFVRDHLNSLNDELNSPIWEIAKVILTYMISLILVRILATVKWLRKACT